MVVFTVRGAIKFKGAHVTLRILQYPMIQNVLVHLTGRCCVRIRRKSDRSAAEWADRKSVV